MKIRIPFTQHTLYIGRKEVESAKQSIMYGAYANTFADFLNNGGYRICFDTLYLIYNNVVDVKQAIRKIQNACMKGGYQLLNKSDAQKTPDAKQIEIANRFLEQKNPSFYQLKDMLIRDFGVAGNGYWLLLKNKAGDFLGLQPVDPRTMTVVADKYGNVQKYLQSVYGALGQTFEKDEMIHSVMDYSTVNPMFGVSPIESIVWEARTEMASQMSNYYFFENNAVPAHLLILEENLSDDQIKTVKGMLDDKFKGASNRFKSGIIPFLKDVKTIAPSQKDMQYIEGRAFSTKKIVVAFGVDAFILGYTENVQRGNSDTIYTEFYENTVRPYENYIEEIINEKLFPLIGCNDIYFSINYSHYDNEEIVATRTRADVLAGIQTINEARRARGLDDHENEFADDLMFNGILLDDLGMETQEIIKTAQEKMIQRNKDFLNLLEK